MTFFRTFVQKSDALWVTFKINDPIARLMGLRYKSHPGGGGRRRPEIVTAFIEMVPTDTVKYELDKVSGYIRIDRPQKYSTVVPALYGFILQSYCGGDSVAQFCMERCGAPTSSATATARRVRTDGAHHIARRHYRQREAHRRLPHDRVKASDKIIAVLHNDTYRDCRHSAGAHVVVEACRSITCRYHHRERRASDDPRAPRAR